MKLDPKSIALLERHEQATIDFLRILTDGAARSVTAELHLNVTPGHPAKSRILAELQPAREVPKASNE